MSKIIFMDIDGVLNCLRTVEGAGYNYDMLDPIGIKMIENLCEQTGAKIVVSSSWRKLYGDNLVSVLGDTGFDVKHFHEDYKTPSSSTGFRGDEINLWLKNHPEVSRYVCIDGDIDYYNNQFLIITDNINGFSLQNYYGAKIYLGKDRDKDLERIFEYQTKVASRKTGRREL